MVLWCTLKAILLGAEQLTVKGAVIGGMYFLSVQHLSTVAS